MTDDNLPDITKLSYANLKGLQERVQTEIEYREDIAKLLGLIIKFSDLKEGKNILLLFPKFNEVSETSVRWVGDHNDRQALEDERGKTYYLWELSITPHEGWSGLALSFENTAKNRRAVVDFCIARGTPESRRCAGAIMAAHPDDFVAKAAKMRRKKSKRK